QLSEPPTTGIPLMLAPPPCGARGGASLPSTKSRISGAARSTNPSVIPAGQYSLPLATTRKSVTPTSVGVLPPAVSPLPLSPWHAVPPSTLAHRNSALASPPQPRLNPSVIAS